MRCTSVVPALAAAVLAAGCITPTPPALYVTPSRATLSPSRPKPPDCALDFYRTKSPDRPYDEVATVHYVAVNGANPDAVQAAIQARVCGLGADAVVITRERYMGYGDGGTEMTATAVVYRAGP